MSVLIKGMEMPCDCDDCFFCLETGICVALLASTPTCGDVSGWRYRQGEIPPFCPLIPVPPHGDLIDRDALMKEGWLNLHKEVIRMGGYAIHELPLKNPSIPVIIPAEEDE